jgi:hypothetical protein
MLTPVETATEATVKRDAARLVHAGQFGQRTPPDPAASAGSRASTAAADPITGDFAGAGRKGG